VREKLRKFKDYKDFLKEYENHKMMHDARSTLFREEGFREINDQLGTDYDFYKE
jgi:hypothetical protein